MPFVDGQGRTRIGRQKGAPNKRTKELREKLTRNGIADPILSLCKMAIDPKLTPDQRRKAAKDAAPFIWPRRGTYPANQQPADAFTEDRLLEKLAAKPVREAKPVGTSWRPDYVVPDTPSIGGTVLADYDPHEDE